jgi:hypothetical protein
VRDYGQILSYTRNIFAGLRVFAGFGIGSSIRSLTLSTINYQLPATLGSHDGSESKQGLLSRTS